MSIQGFSSPSTEYALWAADDHHKPNDVRALLSHLGVRFIPCLGSYKGKLEMSYLTTRAALVHETIKALTAGQESVLILGAMDSRSRRKASLAYSDGYWEDLGVMQSVPVSDAVGREAWTVPLQQDNGEVLAFVCVQTDKFGDAIT